MPFDPNSAKKSGDKSKRGPAKKEEPSIKEKMELLYQKVLDDLLINQNNLTKTLRVKVFVTLSNYIFSKTKSVLNQFTINQLKEIAYRIKYINVEQVRKLAEPLKKNGYGQYFLNLIN